MCIFSSMENIPKKRYKKILLLSAPLIGAMISQNLLNLVDSYMVARISTAALAAVAAGGIINWLSGSAIMSLSTGVQQLAARRLGQDKSEELAFPLNAGLLTGIILSVPFAYIFHFHARDIIQIISDDPAVIQEGTEYLAITFLSIPFYGINYCFRGFWSGINKQKIYMATIIVIHITNGLLNYIFIFGKFGCPALETSGAALASLLAPALGTVIYLCIALKSLREKGFLKGIPYESIKSLVKLSIPNAIQSILYALSYFCLYKIIALLGTEELAAAGIIINFALVCYLPALAFGMVATSMVGQALGKKDPEDADLWAKQICKFCFVALSILSLPFILFPEALLGFFIIDTAVIKIATFAVILLGFSLPLEAIGLVLQHAILGAGDSKKVMILTTASSWLFYLPLAWLLGHTLNQGINGVWIANLIVQASLAATYMYFWKTGYWKNIKI
ncbi:MAG: MATE family efflux transporter [Lentisphaeraceae bacterium]|nr:MATE family efflux transporter [Lentisphaeraceae bacterium]